MADSPRLAASTHSTSPVSTPTTVDVARRRPPRNRLRTTTSVSGPGSSTISADAAAKASRAVSTAPTLPPRPLAGRRHQLLLLFRCRPHSRSWPVTAAGALLVHPFERVAGCVGERSPGETGRTCLRERRAHRRPPVRRRGQRQPLAGAPPAHLWQRTGHS